MVSMNDEIFNLYVSKEGNDIFEGTENNPLASIQGAVDKIKKLKQLGELNNSVKVLIKEGKYEISQPIVITPDSSWPMSFEPLGEGKVIISGGKTIDRFTKKNINGIDMWVTNLPEVKKGKWYFRELFVNGERRDRTRLPKNGFYWMDDVPNVDIKLSCWLQLNNGTDTFVFSDGDIKQFYDEESVEIIAHHFWVDERMPVKSINLRDRVVVSSLRSVFVLLDDVNQKYSKYYVENTFEGLREPGDWYLDRIKGKLYYIPLPGEDIDKVEVVAPCLTQFLRLEGDVDNNEYVEHIKFKKLNFQYSNWYHPAPASNKMPEYFNTPGFDNITKPTASAPQAAIHVPGSIYMKGAKWCSIENCSISHVGFYGIELYKGCEGILIKDNQIYDTGAGGIRVNGSAFIDDVKNHCHKNKIISNHIHGGGKVFLCGIGVLLAHSYDNKIISNEIHDYFYSGISSGWVWGFGESVTRDNLIENNHIYDLGKGLMSDMGGIYTLGRQPGTIIRGNKIHDIEKCNYGGWGIYLDEGSSHIIVEKNIVYNTSSQSFHQHYGRENIIRNNIFAFAREGQIALSRKSATNGASNFECNSTLSAFFYGNKVLSKGQPFIKLGKEFQPDSMDVVFEKNTYFYYKDEGINFAMQSSDDGIEVKIEFDEWNNMGQDFGSSCTSTDIIEIDDDTIQSQSPYMTSLKYS